MSKANIWCDSKKMQLSTENLLVQTDRYTFS